MRTSALLIARRPLPAGPAGHTGVSTNPQLTFKLGYVQKAGQGDPPSIKESGAAMDTDIPGILIVDDNEDNRYTLRLLLESDGHERVIDASGGKEAIALLENEKFNLVLLDLMMPDLNGDEVLKLSL